MTVIQMSDRELTRLRVLIDLVDGRLTSAHGCRMVPGGGDGLKGCAARTGWRRLRPLTPSPPPSEWH